MKYSFSYAEELYFYTPNRLPTVYYIEVVICMTDLESLLFWLPLRGSCQRSGLKEFKKSGPEFSPEPDEMWVSQIKSSSFLAVIRRRGFRIGSKTQIAE